MRRMIIRDSIFPKKMLAFLARADCRARDQVALAVLSSNRHLGLQRERDQFAILSRDARLPDRSAAALMDEGRVADQRRAGRRGGDEVRLAEAWLL